MRADVDLNEIDMGGIYEQLQKSSHRGQFLLDLGFRSDASNTSQHLLRYGKRALN